MRKNEINQSVINEDFYDGDLEQMQAAKNYLFWQRQQVLPHIRGKVIEIGSGVGNFTIDWAERAESLLALEPNAQCFEKLLCRINKNKKVTAMRIFVEQLKSHLAEIPMFDTVVSTNVFEHIPDDRAVMNSLIPFLKPGAKIVLQVPACQWAFGEIDKRLGHYRRYNKSMVKALFDNIPGCFLTLRYYNTVGIFGWWFNARVRKARAQSDFQIYVFDNILHPIQSFFERYISMPFGQCLFIVYEYRPE